MAAENKKRVLQNHVGARDGFYNTQIFLDSVIFISLWVNFVDGVAHRLVTFFKLYIEGIAVESEHPGNVVEVVVGGIFDFLHESNFLSFIR